MSKVNEVSVIVSERIVVGLSSIVGVTLQPFQSEVRVRIMGGSSLEIGGSFSLDGSGASTAFTWGKGYLIGTSEVLSLNAQATFYLAATGATVTALILRCFSPGAYLNQAGN